MAISLVPPPLSRVRGKNMKTSLFAILVLSSVQFLPHAHAAVAQNEAVESVNLDAAFDADETFDVVSSVDVDGGEKLLSATPEDLTRAHVVVVINKSNVGSTAQTVNVYVDGQLTYTFKTSTGREKSETTKSGRKTVTTTPVGYFRIQGIERNHWSNAWKADMPYTVFFNGGIALHATTKSHYAALGKRDSGGCSRLHPDNAKIFFELVKPLPVVSVDQIGRDGKTVLDKAGNAVKVKNRDVLIIVENRI
jgi:lipoprotein-anchoring transpeptidase ErfK/SrfK